MVCLGLMGLNDVLLDCFNLMHLYLLALLQRLHHHCEELFITIRKESVFNRVHSIQHVNMLQNSFDEGYAEILVTITESHVVELLMQNILAHFTIPGNSQHKALQSECNLVLHHSKVFHMLPDTTEQDTLKDLKCALDAEFLKSLDGFGIYVLDHASLSLS